MGYTMDDAKEDLYLHEQYEKASDELAKLHQLIYVFVEGDAEFESIEAFLDVVEFDIQEQGIEIVNLGGVGNAKNFLRFLRMTLSRERPAVLVVDMDEAGISVANNPSIGSDEHTTVVYFPHAPVVELKKGGRGGEYEDSFKFNDLFEACIAVLDDDVRNLIDQEELRNSIDLDQHRLLQIERGIRAQVPGFQSFSKPQVATELASRGLTTPSISNLVNILKKLRSEHPIQSHSELTT